MNIKNILLFLIILCEVINIIEIGLLMNIGKIRGDVYFRIALKDKKASLKIIILCILPLLVVIYSVYYSNYHKTNLLILIVVNLFVILQSIKGILEIKNYSTITTKGILLTYGFFEWKYLKNYKWIEDNSIKIFIKYKNGNYYEDIFSNIGISKNKLDQIFKERLNLN